MFFGTFLKEKCIFLAKYLHKRDKIQIAKSKRKEGDTAEKW